MNTHNWQIRFIQLLSVAGMLVAFYLNLFHSGKLVSICKASGWEDCGKVSGPGAPYASIGPIPVALIGLVGYAIIFLVIWARDWWPALDGSLREILLGLSGFALLLTLGLTALELFVIHAFCRYCLVSAVIVLVIFGLAVSFARAPRADAAAQE